MEKRGTYAGLIEKIPYLKDLGVTAVELLPIFQFDAQDAPPGRVNYWGYQPVSFFAPHQAYSSAPEAAGAGEESRLSAIRAVSDEYPLRGRVKVADMPFAEGYEAQSAPPPGEVWAEARLLAGNRDAAAALLRSPAAGSTERYPAKARLRRARYRRSSPAPAHRRT